VGGALAAGADVLVVNKFGKQEAMGRGFRPLIAEALGLGVPVLTGVSEANLEALLRFAGGMAEPVGPDPEAVVQWWRSLAR
jgi:glycosyltransferase involved in cell wall biosynthesis